MRILAKEFETRRDWPIWLVIGVLVVLGIYFYPQLPERVPIHWNAQGEVDGYGSRFVGAFGLTLTAMGIYVLLLVAPAIEPKRQNYTKFSGIYNLFRRLIVLFMALLQLVSLLSGLGHEVNMRLVVQPALALIFILFGNQLGRVRHNYTFGIKTPWTLADEEIWRKTHRFGAQVFVAAGVVGLLATLVKAEIGFWIFMSSIILASVISMVYSYLLFRAKQSSSQDK